MCNFCQAFDFGRAKAEVDPTGASILFAGGSYRFPKQEQFNFCPVCGRHLKEEKNK